MNIHKNARLTPIGREHLVMAIKSGQTPKAAARDAGVCPQTARKWLRRYERHGTTGLHDRSSRPHKVRQATPPAVIEQVIDLRKSRFPGKEIAFRLGISAATVSRILRAAKLSRVKDLSPPQAPNRYEREKPGEMIHIDIKKLGRFSRAGHRVTGTRQDCRNIHAGWEFVHVCIDDNSRISFSQIRKDERKESAIAFLKASVAYYKSLGVKTERVMTDNGSCYRSRVFAKTCKKLKLKHIFTKPYTPRTNGKAERFIQTALREWAYAKPYETSDLRAEELPRWLQRYNYHRPHSAIGDKPPISRIPKTGNNLLRVHI